MSAGQLDRLVAANEPWWDAERDVCRRYFRSPDRSLERDLLWLRRQAAKELFDGVEVFEGRQAEEEAAHLAAFTAAYERLRRPGDPDIDRDLLAAEVAWPANAELAALRRRHRAEHGAVGAVACRVTEGGRSSLFAEGAALAGGGGADDVIAEACALVHADELDHLAEGLAEVEALGLDEAGWDLLVDLTVAQSRLRVRMREEQFGCP